MNLKSIKASFLSLFKRKKQQYLDIKSRKCLREIKKVIRGLEDESFGMYKWQYLGLERLGLTEADKLADEYILIDQKKSTLKKRERDLVTGIVGMAIVKLMKK